MAWRVLPTVLGFCLICFSYGEENESHTELQRADLFPVSTTGPGAMHQDEAALLGLELKYPNPGIMLMNYRPRLRRYAEKKKKKPNAGAFSPLSMPVLQMPDQGKKTHNSRTKRQGKSKCKKTQLAIQLLNHPNPCHELTSPTEKVKVPKRKQVKKPPGSLSVLSYVTDTNERSGGQREDLDD